MDDRRIAVLTAHYEHAFGHERLRALGEMPGDEIQREQAKVAVSANLLPRDRGSETNL